MTLMAWPSYDCIIVHFSSLLLVLILKFMWFREQSETYFNEPYLPAGRAIPDNTSTLREPWTPPMASRR